MSDIKQLSDDKYKPYKWQVNEVLKFLELYKEAECLWNTNILDYKNKIKREECLVGIKNKLAQEDTIVTVQDIRNKIKSIRTTYSEELNKIIRSSKSGVQEYRPKVFWFRLADSFLKGFTDNRGNTKIKRKIPNGDSASTKRYKIYKHMGNIRNIQSQNASLELNHIFNRISRLENNSTQALEKEDEYDLFGRSIALHLKKLPEHAGLELMQKIQSMVTDMRILYSQNHVAEVVTSEEQEYNGAQDEVLIEVPH